MSRKDVHTYELDGHWLTIPLKPLEAFMLDSILYGIRVAFYNLLVMWHIIKVPLLLHDPGAEASPQ